MANDIKIIVQYETATKAKKEIKDLGTITLKLDQAQKKNSSTSARLASTTKKLSKATKVQSSANHQLASSYKAVGGAAMVGGKKMNTFNMRIQQGGYQLQDFVVQMQSGTSFFTAFSQQGSQFAGIFGPAGAVLGAVIAIGSVIGALAFKAYQGSKDIRTMQESVEDLASASNNIKSAVDDINRINANGNLTSASEAMLSIAKSSKSIAEAQMSSAMLSFTNQAKISAGIFENILDSAMASSSYIYNLLNPFTALPSFDIGDFTGESSIQKNFEELGIQAGYGLYESVVKSLKESMATGEAEEQLKALQRYINVLTIRDGKTTEPTTDKGKEALKNALALSAVLVNQIKAEQAIIDKQIKEEEKRQKAVLEGIAIFRAANKKADEERLSAEEKRQKAVLEGIDIFRAANKKAAAEKEELETRAFNRRFEAEDQLMSMPLKVDKATQKKIDEAVELNRQQDDFLAKQKVQLGIATRISGQTGEELFAAQQINEMVLFKLELDKLELKAGDEKYNQLVTYKELMQEANARTFYRIQLEKEAAEAKRIADAEAQRVNDILLDQYSRIEKELEDQAQKQKGLADGIANTFGDAFMSIVDGTESAKDAFRSMARDIIKQLYQILVVEQMVNSISGAIQGSFGGAPQGPMPSGNVVPDTRMFKLANGGVIGGPTSFRTSSGQSGLMGEAGPEAIMPLKRGANGKLGVQMEGGGATTVVQNFNFSANGDDSVKRIIAQAAPKIAQMTKSEIINDRKRGGSMKAAFG